MREKKLTNLLLSLAIILLMLIILFDSTTYSKSVLKGIDLFYTAVLPGLLPFMFLCKLLTSLNQVPKLTNKFSYISNKLFKINHNGFYAFLMSIISGYPIGAKITNDLYLSNKIDEKQATHVAIISSSSGLIFIIGTIGANMLSSSKLGLIIYISNILSLIIVSILASRINLKQKTIKIEINNKIENKKTTLFDIIFDTCQSLLVVCFYIAIFSLIIDLLNNLQIINFLSTILSPFFNLLNINQHQINGFLSGLVEMTSGAKSLSLINNTQSIALISSLISFGGFSIILQSFAFLDKTPINKKLFILAKILQALFSYLICYIILIII